MSTFPASRVAVITGAGSGVGRAIALKLAGEGWSLALVGRRADALRETITLAGAAADSRLGAFPCDVGDEAAVRTMGAAVLERFGKVDALVAAAGTNTRQRFWREVASENYHDIMAANLHGPFYCVQAFLPHMRERRAGTFVFINSEAGLVPNAKSGPSYIISKFGLTGLAKVLNAEERANGIRVSSIFPGDINTELLNRRPQPPTAEARTKMMQPEDIAACVSLVLAMPTHTVVEEIVMRPL